MQNRILLIALFAAGSFLANAQYEDPKEKETFGQRLVFGGNLGLNFGSITYVEVSPTVGYKVTDRLISGVGLSYIYWQAGDYSTSMYGGSLYSQYLILNNFLAQVEYQMINLDCIYFNIIDRRTVPHLWVGGGYHTGRGQGLGIAITALYDLIQDPCSPYQNPNLRIGMAYGF